MSEFASLVRKFIFHQLIKSKYLLTFKRFIIMVIQQDLGMAQLNHIFQSKFSQQIIKIYRLMKNFHPSIQYISLIQVEQIINQTFLKLSYRKHVQNMLQNNADKKIPTQSLNYANKLVHQIIKKSCTLPSQSLSQAEQLFPDTNLNAMQAKIENKDKFRISSMDFENYQAQNRRRSSRFKDKLINSQSQVDYIIDADIKRKANDRSSYFSESSSKINTKIIRHPKTSTQINLLNASKKVDKNSFYLLPLVQNPKGQEESKQSKPSNKELEYQINALRNKKIKLEAAFSCFNEPKACLGGNQNKQTDTNRYNSTSKVNQDQMLKSIVTDYNGQVIANLPVQKLRKYNTINKQTLFKSNVPIVRIKTQIATNYIQLSSNKKSFKLLSKKCIKHKTRQSVNCLHVQTQPQSPMLIYQRKSKSSISDINQQGKSMFDVQKIKLNNEKSIQQSTYNYDELIKSKRAIQRQMKSKKTIVFI